MLCVVIGRLRPDETVKFTLPKSFYFIKKCLHVCVYVRVCVSFTGSQAIHQTKFSHHTHTHKQNQRTDSSMKASSRRCRRSLCLWLYHAASLLAATKTAKKMFAPLPTAFWGKVFNLLHMHAKRGVVGGVEERGRGEQQWVRVLQVVAACSLHETKLRRSLCCTNLQARSALIRSHTLPLSLFQYISLSLSLCPH